MTARRCRGLQTRRSQDGPIGNVVQVESSGRYVAIRTIGFGVIGAGAGLLSVAGAAEAGLGSEGGTANLLVFSSASGSGIVEVSGDTGVSTILNYVLGRDLARV